MNIKKQSFLALDIGTGSVRGFGIIQNKLYLHCENGDSQSNNIANTIDAIEEKLKTRFSNVYITGNFGIVELVAGKNAIYFPKPHKITDPDVYNAIFNSPDIQGTQGQTLHLIPSYFSADETETETTHNLLCQSLTVNFNCITYPSEVIVEIKKYLAHACMPAVGFFDPIYLLGQKYNGTSIFIDFGRTTTKVGLFENGCLLMRFDINMGQIDITKELSEKFNINMLEAERIKLMVLSTSPGPSDDYILADEKYGITRFDVWETWNTINARIVESVFEKLTDFTKYDIYIVGCGTNADNIKHLILENQGLDNITLLNDFAIVGAFSKMFTPSKRMARKKITYLRHIPIFPSVMCWDIKNDYIYKLFKSVGITKVHLDIMDGFYTDKVSGTFEDLKRIRKSTVLGMHTHLMVEDPLLWIDKAIKIGCNPIIVSTGSRNVVEALRKIKLLGKKCGLALHPNFDLNKLKPELLTMLDEVMIMGVEPGAAGQAFLPDTIKRIRIMANSRKKYGFDYKISVDGGINDKTAKDCWNNDADFLISGSYLKNAPDFADAVIKLLKH